MTTTIRLPDSVDVSLPKMAAGLAGGGLVVDFVDEHMLRFHLPRSRSAEIFEVDRWLKGSETVIRRDGQTLVITRGRSIGRMVVPAVVGGCSSALLFAHSALGWLEASAAFAGAYLVLLYLVNRQSSSREIVHALATPLLAEPVTNASATPAVADSSVAPGT